MKCLYSVLYKLYSVLYKLYSVIRVTEFEVHMLALF